MDSKKNNLLHRVVNSWKSGVSLESKITDKSLLIPIPGGALLFIVEHYADQFSYDEVFEFILALVKNEKTQRDVTLPVCILFLKDKKKFLRDMNTAHAMGRISADMIEIIRFYCADDGLYFGVYLSRRRSGLKENNLCDPEYREFLEQFRGLVQLVREREKEIDI
ncbi:MAG: hypothetical protein Q7S47_01235 [bacterium]|nr:hypothetical protein [bacterium]